MPGDEKLLNAVLRAFDQQGKWIALYACVRLDALGSRHSPHHLDYFLRIHRAD